VKFDVGMLTHDLKSIPDYARRVEALGFDCLWSSETQHDPFLPLAVAATVTSRVRLGTAIAVAFPRSPMILAHIAWDLAKASDGRFILGLGTQVKGHNERRFSVRFESPGPKMAEAVRATAEGRSSATARAWSASGRGSSSTEATKLTKPIRAKVLERPAMSTRDAMITATATISHSAALSRAAISRKGRMTAWPIRPRRPGSSALALGSA